MYCNACGREVPPDSRFCNRCGKPQSPVGTGPAAPSGRDPDIGTRNPSADAPPPNSGLRIPNSGPAPETELWRGGVSPRAFGGRYVAWVAWTVFLATLWLFVLQNPQPWMNWVLLGMDLLPLAWLVLRTLHARLSLRYRLTSHRLFREEGILGRRIAEIELFRVDDVAVAQGVLERLFGVGTVTLVTSDAGEPRLTIAGVDRPVEVKERIREAVRAARAKTINIQSV